MRRNLQDLRREVLFIAVPIVLLYFFLVKDMVNGMAAGAVKG